jgi:hypothetical protein
MRQTFWVGFLLTCLGLTAAGCGSDSACPKPFKTCGSACVDPFTDFLNCGGCGNQCAAGQICSAAACTATCAPGLLSCNGTCLDVRVDPNNCGACGTACSGATPICFGSTCVAQAKVLILGADASAALLANVKTNLLATGAFSTVDTFEASGATPTLAQLGSYDAVLVYSDSTAFADPATLGNVLADYYDGGGHVVLAWAANQTGATAVAGRFASGGYLLINPGASQLTADYLGDRLDPASPLLGGVEYLNLPGGFLATGAVVNGGVVVARWNKGVAAVVRGVVKGRNRCDVNVYPVSGVANASSWTGDGTALLRNALLYR